MAKKNLTSLIDGIMGTPTEKEDLAPEQRPESVAARKSSATGSDNQMHESSRKGSPAKAKSPDADSEIRATFIVSQEQLRKIKYISLFEDSLQKDIVGEAFGKYIENWEKENGKIRLPKSKR